MVKNKSNIISYLQDISFHDSDYALDSFNSSEEGLDQGLVDRLWE